MLGASCDVLKAFLSKRSRTMSAPSRPNILYIHSHDTGRYIQPYGHAIPTPRLQRLAEEGVLFRQAITANPTCSPSRACLVTGMSAHSNGMLGLAHRGFSLNDYGQHMIHTLHKEGYTSALSGVQHVANPKISEGAEKIGYHKYLGDPNEAHTKACEYLDNAPDQPFFLTVGFFETHRDFPEVHPHDDARYCMPPLPLPDTKDNREDMARFKESARILDWKMGTVFDALERNGLAENTLVICTTDHGIAFPRMKCTLADSGIGIMLMMRGPGGFTGGKVMDGLVSQIDIFPTICDYLGIDHPDWLEGNSLMPMVAGEVEEVQDEIFSEVNYHAAYEPKRCARTKRHKYIRRYGERKVPTACNVDAGLSKDTWLEAGWCEQKLDDEQLYDVIFDPAETRNLVDHPDYQDALVEMRGRLEGWMKRTNDPLLDGDVPLPETALCNAQDCVHPRDAKLLKGQR
jgi:N-sulfoglucosamine sulfohydrolase